MNSRSTHRIVIVGGGAGGLQLATRLGDKLGRRNRAHIVLVDRSPTHLWKPLLHEVAAGSLDIHAHQVEYIAQARWHHFEFQQGALTELDRERKTITLAPTLDDDGLEILPRRELAYDTLVLAIGSVTNFFNTPGAAEHAFALDTVYQAERFRKRLIAECMRAQNHLGEHAGASRPQVRVVIIGGGATGVELSAELRNTAHVLRAYGLHQLDPVKDIRIAVVEGGPRLLGPLPERVSDATADLLRSMNIDVLTGERVTGVEEDAVTTASGKRLPAHLVVWAAGIRAPDVLGQLGLPVNRLGQIEVRTTLQTNVDPDIFAFGDCSYCPQPQDEGKPVPPRAQAAHQQAAFLAKSLQRRLEGKPLPEFVFSDLGSLVSLGRFSAVGNLMGNLVGGSLLVDGLIARFLYNSLYRRHVMELRGFVRMMVDTLVHWLRRRTTPRIKLH